MQPVFILAGNYNQALQFARKMDWDRNEWRYLSCIDYLRGIKNSVVYKVGTWMYREDLEEWDRVFTMVGAEVREPVK